MYFNFNNSVLRSHREVRQAMAMAIDHQALIHQALQGFAHPLCTDPGPDGVRAKDGQRLEFDYSTTATYIPWRSDVEAIIQRNFQEIGIKLDIENYSHPDFFNSFLLAGEASPSTGAVPGRFDIAEFGTGFGPDPDDSSLLGCDQIPPKGFNITFYCNPAIDALYQQELATADAGKRQEIFYQLHQIYLSEFPFIVLFGLSALSIARQGAHSYRPSAFVGPSDSIAEWWCDHGTC
jgi:peptide/nickel transport system substrate-binding protein